MALSGNADSFTAPSNFDASQAFGAAGFGAGQYRAVGRNSSGKIVLCEASAVLFDGILQDDPAVGRNGTVKYTRQSKAIAGAAFALNARLVPDATGRLVDAAGGAYVARALDAAAGAGSVVRVVIASGTGIV